LTFAELDDRTRQVAGQLADHGIGRGARVGVSLHRGADLVVALLAVWRVGAAYVPLDPAYPQDRLTYMVESADVRTVLAEADSGTAWPTGVETILLADAVSAQATDPDVVTAESPLTDPAYVIFTSGSTGMPKGVEVTRGGVASLIADLEDAGYYAEQPRVVAWNASFSFDASVQQWARICRGDSIVVISDSERTDPDAVRARLDEHAVDDLTPSHWTLLRETLLAPTADGRTLRLFMGGEPVPADVWKELGQARQDGMIEAINLYGPTECTVDSTATWITGEGPHIGRPLPGFAAYVLDDALRAAAVGEPGELYLAGAAVANGYVNQPALTAQRFVADPFAVGGRMYRTGDRVRLRPDGTIDYLGRVDRQIKIRGCRVELDEIETALAEHPDVGEAVVILYATATVGDQLVGYYVSSGERAPRARELQEHLAGLLPPYMIPSAFVMLTAMPLSVNGKVDHRALPVEALWPSAEVEEPQDEEPQGEIEMLSAGV
jgi:amino acid adenylation domain-containing protein